ncbi:MAG: hypothetical protein HC860_26190 [Alkalinema sp. RU_4_3]|nr:hypothetical protein [Alkalinema sp. RU_4_3]
MFTPGQILKVAKDIKPQLFQLLPADRAEIIDRQLTQLITRQEAGENLAQEIIDLIDSQPELSTILRPLDTRGGSQPPAGDPAPTPASEDTPFKGIPPSPSPDNSKQK